MRVWLRLNWNNPDEMKILEIYISEPLILVIVPVEQVTVVDSWNFNENFVLDITAFGIVSNPTNYWNHLFQSSLYLDFLYLPPRSMTWMVKMTADRNYKVFCPRPIWSPSVCLEPLKWLTGKLLICHNFGVNALSWIHKFIRGALSIKDSS